MDASSVCRLLLVVVVLCHAANGHPCGNSELCLEPGCIKAASRILSVMDTTADPCQDFYQYACGNYEEVTEIPDGRSKWTPFKQTEKKIRKVLRKILERDGYDFKGNHSEALRKAKTYYKTCLNDTANELAGTQPLLNLIESLGGWGPLGNFTAQRDEDPMVTLARVYKIGSQALFAVDVWPDDRNPREKIMIFQQHGLSLISPENYLDDDSSTMDAFVKLGADVVTLIVEPHEGSQHDLIKEEARVRMREILEFEKEMSKIYIPASKTADFDAAYNKMPLRKLMSKMPDVDLLSFVTEHLGREVDVDMDVVVYTPSYLRELNKLMRDTPDRVIRDYMIWYGLQNLLDFLPKTFRDAKLEFRKVARGVSKEIPLSERCMAEVDSNFMMVTGALFVEASKSHEKTKQRAVDMLHEIKGVFVDNLPSVAWLTDKSTDAMRDKVESTIEIIGYPDWILDPARLDAYYDGVDAGLTNRLDNIVSNKKFAVQMEVDSLGVPVDSNSSWELGPTDVQAEYDLFANQITFTSGILQPPFYSENVPMSINFGAIGTIMGNKLLHGYGEDGSAYDKYGQYGDWGFSGPAFTRATKCMVSQYSKYQVGGVNIDGQRTLAENVADNGGVRFAFEAFQNWYRANRPDLSLPLNLTIDQEFFVGMGQTMCSFITPQQAKLNLQRSLKTEERYRVIGSLSNQPAFSEAFNCPVGSPMNPADKCQVWGSEGP